MKRILTFITFIFVFVGLFINAHAQIIAVVSGAETESKVAPKLVFVDVEMKQKLFEIECAQQASIPNLLMEYNSKLYMSFGQSYFSTPNPGTVLTEFSINSLNFVNTEVIANHLAFYKKNPITADLWFWDEKNNLVTWNLNQPKIEIVPAEMTKQRALNSTFLPDGGVLEIEDNKLFQFDRIDDWKNQVIENSREYFVTNSETITHIEDISVQSSTNGGIALRYYNANGENHIAIISQNLDAIVSEKEITQTNQLLGWSENQRSVLLFESERKAFEDKKKFIIQEYDLETEEITTVNEFALENPKLGGVTSVILCKNKRYLVIGNSHVGGLKYTSPALLIIYDRLTDEITTMEFETGSISEIVELSDESINLFLQKIDQN